MKYLFVLLLMVSSSFASANPLDGVTLDASSYDGVLSLTLNGACDFDIKMVEVYFNDVAGAVIEVHPDHWLVETNATKGTFTAVICTESLCIPVAIDFNAIPWDGKVPDLAAPRRLTAPSPWVPALAVGLIAGLLFFTMATLWKERA